MNKVQQCLSENGRIRIVYNFLWRGVIHVYDQDLGAISVRKIRDQSLLTHCCDFLTAQKANFETMDELRKWAVANGWPEVSNLPDLDCDD